MPRNDDLYLHDILIAIERIERYMDGMTLDALESDELKADGILFNLMTIGEAVKNIPDRVRSHAPDIRWRDISRFRDRIVHHYFSIDLVVIWEIVTIHLPPLKIYIQQILDDTFDNIND